MYLDNVFTYDLVNRGPYGGLKIYWHTLNSINSIVYRLFDKLLHCFGYLIKMYYQNLLLLVRRLLSPNLHVTHFISSMRHGTYLPPSPFLRMLNGNSL